MEVSVEPGVFDCSVRHAQLADFNNYVPYKRILTNVSSLKTDYIINDSL